MADTPPPYGYGRIEVSDIGTVSPSKGLYWRLCLLGLGLFLVGTNAVVIAGLLPHISETLGYTAALTIGV